MQLGAFLTNAGGCPSGGFNLKSLEGMGEPDRLAVKTWCALQLSGDRWRKYSQGELMAPLASAGLVAAAWSFLGEWDSTHGRPSRGTSAEAGPEVSLTQMAFIAFKVSNLLKVGANEVVEAEIDKTIGSDQGAIEAMQRQLYDLGESVQWAIKGVRIPEQYRSAPAEAAGRQ